jgi:hypothetical protein
MSKVVPMFAGSEVKYPRLREYAKIDEPVN